MRTEYRLAPPLCEAERHALRFVEREHPEMREGFLSALPGARRATVGRLLSGMLREGVAGLGKPLEWRDGVRGVGGRTFSVPLPEGNRLSFRGSGPHAFGRVEVEGAVSLDGGGEVGTVAELMGLVRVESASLVGELENGCANLAMARAFFERKRTEWRGFGSSLDASRMLRRGNPSLDPSLFFERLCVEGHNLHPGAKTRMGMAHGDVFRHAAEFDGEANLRIVGVRRDMAECASLDGRDPGAVLFGCVPGLRGEVEAYFEGRGLSFEEYMFVPAHPWQAENVVGRLYEAEIEAGVVVAVPGLRVPADATGSLRTVAVRGVDLHVKASVSSQMTSTTRSISPNTAINAPEFSRVLREIMAREPRIASTFVPVREISGAAFAPEAADADFDAKSRSLSAVLREGLMRHVRPGESAVPGFALYAESPASGKTVLEELVGEYGEAMRTPPPSAAVHFVREYAELVLPGFLTLMGVYGVGLEGHLQNCVPLFEGGRPVRLLVRDWGGSRVHPGRLRSAGVEARFAPGSVTVADGVDDVRRKVFHAVFGNHLGEVTLRASKSFRVPERDLWREVRHVCEDVFDTLAARPGLAARVASDRAALLAPNVHHKALVTMRLEPEKGDLHVKVPNPLHESREEKHPRERNRQ